ncbi:hypothetical protein [Capillimicrobium parvum]|uniref:Uncharacterized protein n=1 Tax=Capillimicrobium parvum TaxID=2884022 RepID=A0A9E7C0Y7_9ACTN|nr:hypothetical protein [Capillimicrobium parvum]UGS36871.1 hypothetical protein DSM104329_03282 [Capillimicrobium parvum]
MHGAWPWILVALLGAYHGLNPAMGWLFAVGLGMQDGDRRSVKRALVPIAIGHEASIAVVAALVLGLGVVTDQSILHMVAGGVLVGFGLFRFARPRAHPRWTRMRVNRGELTWWSFLMSSAHGAGLMVAPILIGVGAADATADGGQTLGHVDVGGLSVITTVLAVSVHVAAMLAVMGAISLVVYDRFGTALLRKTWLNLDWLWAGAFIVAGVVTFFT